MKKATRKFWIFCSGTTFGLTSLSIALGAVPAGGKGLRVTDDTAIYQRLSDIQVPRQGRLDFDADISRLSSIEPRYREKLPPAAARALKDPRVANPMKRISSQQYRFSGTKNPSSRDAVRN